MRQPNRRYVLVTTLVLGAGMLAALGAAIHWAAAVVHW